ncbi:riboflavin biosynthesis RibT protein [Lactobacillus bombicola]|uniref:Riboflavin biosynthesis RibT protein n=1 Tax=Lactobacillus bombicola TaxID=1505723 RepID=A0A1I1R2D8_9LACO|nr:reductase [Lactobacillus bombicola]MCO6528238.1 reductase [Lactobacillus sp.]SFD28422.1 riboflavin biosynthesis RibT protein [Lactobacillus bombicola]
MLIECKKDNEKIAMGLLSYLDDFKNINVLKEEIKLNKNSSEFQLYLYRELNSNFIGVIGIQNYKDFIVVRYLSLSPNYRQLRYKGKIIHELACNNPDKRITALPEFTKLVEYFKNKEL